MLAQLAPTTATKDIMELAPTKLSVSQIAAGQILVLSVKLLVSIYTRVNTFLTVEDTWQRHIKSIYDT